MPRGKSLCASLLPEDQQLDFLQPAPSQLEYVHLGAQAQSPEAIGRWLPSSSLSPSGGQPCLSQKDASFRFAIQFHPLWAVRFRKGILLVWSESSSFISKREGNKLYKIVEQLKRKYYLNYLKQYQALVGSQELLVPLPFLPLCSCATVR